MVEKTEVAGGAGCTPSELGLIVRVRITDTAGQCGASGRLHSPSVPPALMAHWWFPFVIAYYLSGWKGPEKSGNKKLINIHF